MMKIKQKAKTSDSTNLEIPVGIKAEDAKQSVNSMRGLSKQVTPSVVKFCRQITQNETDSQHQILLSTQHVILSCITALC